MLTLWSVNSRGNQHFHIFSGINRKVVAAAQALEIIDKNKIKNYVSKNIMYKR